MFESGTSGRAAVVADNRNEARLGNLSQGWNVGGGYRRDVRCRIILFKTLRADCPWKYELVGYRAQCA
ncbi:hypothetical protein PGTUg99_019543 [Puccinia graminis f. sp. tritici]|uniref:Uncharacterized protein n=1 Tax=Puccinia graminis f. sp. tritici TaxID=56615 RepID=A0A5B0MPT5_PUCGR|nr:hypothetical protein PGTUg99_019543 [Puccinia graminis f. sp. tritici]